MNKNYKIFGLAVACIFGLNTIAKAQVRANFNVGNDEAVVSSAFFDASSSGFWNASENEGKGLVFPRTDLTLLKSLVITGPNIPSNYPTFLDGMLVYNTATGISGLGGVSVTPGFYYYSNQTQDINGGIWTPLKGAGGANGGKFIVSTQDNLDGTFTFNYSDGTTFTTGNLKGGKGDKGDTGFSIQGLPGTTGQPGLPGSGTAGAPGAGVTIVTNDSGTWVFNPIDNSWTNINGPKGDKGDTGFSIQGLPGTTGQPGIPGSGTAGAPGVGVTIVTNDSGTWIFNPIDNSWTNIKGTDGSNGAAGNGVVSTVFNVDGTITYTYTDGTTFTTPVLKGDKGDKGDTGFSIQGLPGTTGQPGIPGSGTAGAPGAGVTIVTNDSGTWVFNPITQTWTNINGPKGDAGTAGTNGVDGLPGANGDKGDTGFSIQGLPGTTGQPGLPGSGTAGAPGAGVTIVTNDSGTWVFNPIDNSWTNINGPKGDVGAAGTNGIDGLPGAKGDKGDAGTAGTNGVDGLPGAKGDKGDAGAAGTNGIDGLPGAKGDKGDVGAIGKGIQTTTDNGDGTITYTYTDGTTFTTPNLKGPKGDAGAAGTNGVDGLPGAKGDKGDAGAAGTNGVDGLPGAKGDKGDAGAAGTNGVDGLPGAKGDKGDAGTNGTNGIDGLPGAKGDKGDVGATGKGIQTTTDNGDGTITYTYTDGTTFTTPNLKGPKGDAGAAGTAGTNGIDGLPGAKGDKGDAGAAGTNGVDGLPGAKGDKGDTGFSIQGLPGTTGQPGIPGSGTPGAPGAGITIVTNDSGTWVFNPTTQTWTNIKGADGKDGLTNGVAGGDLSGNYPNPTVIKIQNIPVDVAIPIDDQVLTFQGGKWVPTTPKEMNGIAGGDLSGNYPNPTVIQIQSIPVDATKPLIDEVLTFDGVKWVPKTLSAVAQQNIYTTDGALQTARTVDMNNNNLVFAGKGNIGIGIQPEQKFDVDGSVQFRKAQFVNIRTDNGNAVTVGPDDYYILLTNTNPAINITLPDAKLNKGRMLIFMVPNAATTGQFVLVNGVSPYIGQPGYVTAQSATGIISDGNNWYNTTGY